MSVYSNETRLGWGLMMGFLEREGRGVRLDPRLLEILRSFIPDGKSVSIGSTDLLVLNAIQKFRPGLSEADTVNALNVVQGMLRAMDALEPIG